ncbi:competence/damage-inducible protein A [Alkalicella caledoniensis]|uniref:Putative competence-damage inducible protein n=1 Tax=Alkalicella caledoniensis TaxID=2731377 RepID=A0A7G9WCT3_ALKCA|nr:competence/damage-inducible protein A [Alkalicella caledoniensis]QNO16495.1 competence/damage-inducible protein A [Alkalicella caledoniensis]
MKGEIIAVGTELLLGDIVNTNAQFISQKCAFIGLNIYYHTSVGDNSSRLATVLHSSLSRSDVIIITGGLGPTKDDLTKEVVAKVLNKPLKLNWQWYKTINKIFSKRATIMPSNNIKQALIPKGAEILTNKNGTACGIYINSHGKHLFLLPGPPREMFPMFEDKVLPKLFELEENLGRIHSRVIKTYGIGESALVEKIDDIITNQTDPTICTLAKNDGIHVRITTNTDQDKITKTLSTVEMRLKEYVWGYDDDSVNQLIVKTLKDKKLSVSTVESCTGGAIASSLTDVPGSASVYTEGTVLYTEQSKANFLHCSLTEIPQGGIEEQLTIKLAKRAKEVFSTSIAFAITGALGPTAPKGVEVGTIFMAIVLDNKIVSKEFKFYGSRENIKEKAILAALHLIYKNLNEEPLDG